MEEKANWILYILGGIAAFFSFRWLIRLLGMSDGKEGFGFKDFKNLLSLSFFLWASVYIITKEANRPQNTEHIFSEMWLAFVFCGLLYVLSMEFVFDKFAEILKLLIDLRARTRQTTTTDSTTQTVTTTGKPEQEA